MKDDEKRFRDAFVANFLAAYAATKFDDACRTGQHATLEKLPVEDADFLSGCAWDHYVEILGVDKC